MRYYLFFIFLTLSVIHAAAGFAESRWVKSTPGGNSIYRSESGDGTVISTYLDSEPFVKNIRSYYLYPGYITGKCAEGYYAFNEDSHNVEYFNSEIELTKFMHDNFLFLSIYQIVFLSLLIILLIVANSMRIILKIGKKTKFRYLKKKLGWHYIAYYIILKYLNIIFVFQYSTSEWSSLEIVIEVIVYSLLFFPPWLSFYRYFNQTRNITDLKYSAFRFYIMLLFDFIFISFVYSLWLAGPVVIVFVDFLFLAAYFINKGLSLTFSLRNTLKSQYSFKVRNITPAPRGFVAETFFLETDHGNKFLKIFDNYRLSQYVIPSLPVLDTLYAKEINFISKPVKTTSGGYHFIYDEKLHILFDGIEGKQSYEFDHIQYFNLLSEIYIVGRNIEVSEEIIEDFKITCFEEYPKYRDIFLNYEGVEEEELLMREILRENKSDLNRMWIRFNQLCKECKDIVTDFYITHGDGPGNIMLSKDKMYLVDWDDLKKAPLERDAWFHYHNKDDLKKFINIMRSKGIDFVPNNKLIDYYLYKRFFDDITDNLEVILNTDNIEKKRKANQDTIEDCFKWTFKLMLDDENERKT